MDFDDVKRCIASQCESFDDVCSLRRLSLSWWRALSDRHFEEAVANQYTIQRFGDGFWEKARKRDVAYSKPLGSYHREVVRLKRFLEWHETHLSQTLTMRDFEVMWDGMERPRA